jgi:acetyl-CoA C-acetyltransferase
MFSDAGGEESPLLKHHHPDLVQQGIAAEILSQEFAISRKDADEFAYLSQVNAKRALEERRFTRSVIPVPFVDEQGIGQIIDGDDNPRLDTTLTGLQGLKPVFKEDGIITAGNASAIVDGAAAVLIASEGSIKKHSLKPRARIVAQSVVGSPPRVMLTGPIEATRQVLAKAGLQPHQIDVWEINEAFAPVPILTMREIGIDPTKVNVNGGGISLGHPLGATGAILIGMAVDELERTSQRYALITMCIGLGMGIATIVERV